MTAVDTIFSSAPGASHQIWMTLKVSHFTASLNVLATATVVVSLFPSKYEFVCPNYFIDILVHRCLFVLLP